jgi:polysaccharide chain length determinant protein (PEP-CTERM system associated)
MHDDDDLDGASSKSLEEYWAIVVRRRWWIFLPLFVCWALVWGASWFLPTAYRSEALILVEQQKVPEQYVVPNVSVSLQDRLQSMTQQILSRTRLQATIDRFGLYPKGRGPSALLNLDEAVEQMRKDIKIDLVASPEHPGELTSFRIEYSARTREVAQQVNSELTSLFIDENLKSQQQQSENTTAFLESQLSTARTQLEEQEAKVRAFKAKHFGDLPSQLETNVQILTGLQTQLDSNQRALDGAKQQKLYLESLLQQYQTLQGVQGRLGSGGTPETSTEVLDKELLDLRTKLADARSHYTEDFPDVASLKQKIDATEKLKKTMDDEIDAKQKAVQAASTGDTAAAAEPRYDSSAPMMQVRSQLKANELEIQNYQHHATDIESQIATYRSRLNMTPETEQELADISRGYEESKANYNSLLQKQNLSQLATSLEQRQQGEQFRIIDPPSLPEKPSSPNHFRVSLIGLALGAGIGLGLVVLLELANARVWHEKELEGLVPGRILVGIPHLSTGREDSLRPLFRWLQVGAALAMTLAIAAGNLYSFYKG